MKQATETKIHLDSRRSLDYNHDGRVSDAEWSSMAYTKCFYGKTKLIPQMAVGVPGSRTSQADPQIDPTEERTAILPQYGCFCTFSDYHERMTTGTALLNALYDLGLDLRPMRAVLGRELAEVSCEKGMCSKQLSDEMVCARQLHVPSPHVLVQVTSKDTKSVKGLDEIVHGSHDANYGYADLNGKEVVKVQRPRLPKTDLPSRH